MSSTTKGRAGRARPIQISAASMMGTKPITSSTNPKKPTYVKVPQRVYTRMPSTASAAASPGKAVPPTSTGGGITSKTPPKELFPSGQTMKDSVRHYAKSIGKAMSEEELDSVSEQQDEDLMKMEEFEKDTELNHGKHGLEWVKSMVEYYRNTAFDWVRKHLKSDDDQLSNWKWRDGTFVIRALRGVRDGLVELVLLMLTSTRFWFYISEGLVRIKDMICRKIMIKLGMIELISEKEASEISWEEFWGNARKVILGSYDYLGGLMSDKIKGMVNFSVAWMSMSNMPGIDGFGKAFVVIMGMIVESATDSMLHKMYIDEGIDNMTKFFMNPCFVRAKVANRSSMTWSGVPVQDADKQGIFNRWFSWSGYAYRNMVERVAAGQQPTEKDLAIDGGQEMWEKLERERDEGYDIVSIYKNTA